MDDDRSSEEIIRAFRATGADWECAQDLGIVWQRGGIEEFEIGKRYTASAAPIDRITGAAVLAQLGCAHPTFVEESVDLLIPLLDDQDERVAIAAGHALGHRGSPRAIAPLLRRIEHPNEDVRFSIIGGLSGQDDPAAIDGLVRLTRDVDSDVRDWAAFGLGTLTDLDSPELRNALAALLDDPDEDVRGEAMVGLAKRKDLRALPAIERELRSKSHGSLCVEAAEFLGHPSLLPLLLDLKGRLNPDLENWMGGQLEKSISRCQTSEPA
jgi:HEAT repeat protein